MTKDDIQLLYEYDRWANRRVLQSAASLPTEQFTRDLGGAFRSVRDTLVHILAGEWTWLAYWRETPRDPAFLAELVRRRESLFHPELYPDLAAVRGKWAEIEKDQVDFVNCVTEGSLGELLPARNTQLSLMHLMQHLANHSTYHRGQISLMMRQLGAEPVATDFHVFLGERQRQAEPA